MPETDQMEQIAARNGQNRADVTAVRAELLEKAQKFRNLFQLLQAGNPSLPSMNDVQGMFVLVRNKNEKKITKKSENSAEEMERHKKEVDEFWKQYRKEHPELDNPLPYHKNLSWLEDIGKIGMSTDKFRRSENVEEQLPKPGTPEFEKLDKDEKAESIRRHKETMDLQKLPRDPVLIPPGTLEQMNRPGSLREQAGFWDIINPNAYVRANFPGR